MFTDIVLMSLKYFGIFILTNLVLVFLISIILNSVNIVKYFNEYHKITVFVFKFFFHLNSILIYFYLVNGTNPISEIITHSRFYFAIIFIPLFSLNALAKITSKSYFEFHKGKSARQIELELKQMPQKEIKETTISALLGLSFNFSLRFPILLNISFLLYPPLLNYINSIF